MLSRLAIEVQDTADEYAVFDPACGDGALLLAGGREVRRQGGQPLLIGMDIMWEAVRDAHIALNAAGMHRHVLWCMPHGPQPDGGVAAGALEILSAHGRGPTDTLIGSDMQVGHIYDPRLLAPIRRAVFALSERLSR